MCIHQGLGGRPLPVPALQQWQPLPIADGPPPSASSPAAAASARVVPMAAGARPPPAAAAANRVVPPAGDTWVLEEDPSAMRFKLDHVETGRRQSRKW